MINPKNYFSAISRSDFFDAVKKIKNKIKGFSGIENLHIQYHHSFGHNITQLDLFQRSCEKSKSFCIFIRPQHVSPWVLPIFIQENIFVIDVLFSNAIYELYAIAQETKIQFLNDSEVFIPSVTSTDEIYRHISDKYNMPKDSLISDKHNICRQRPQFASEICIMKGIGGDRRFPDIYENYMIKLLRKSLGDINLAKIAFINPRSMPKATSSCSYLRDAVFPDTSVLALKLLQKKGYLLISSWSESICNSLPIKIISLESITKSKQVRNLLSIFFLMEAAFYWGAQSGPIYLRAIARKTSFITDAYPPCIGTLNQGDVNLFKEFYNGREKISFENLVDNPSYHQILFGGLQSIPKKLYFERNSPQSILGALEWYFYFNSLTSQSQKTIKRLEINYLNTCGPVGLSLKYHKSITFNLINQHA